MSIEATTISKVKQLLWEGESQDAIAAQLGLSQASISRIKSGRIGAVIPWPNGTIGAMPPLTEFSQVVTKYRTYPPLIQERMLYAVNERRRENGLEPIPPSSPEYNEYISSPLRSPDLEATAAVRAASQEEARIAKVSEEFELIVQGAIQANIQLEMQHVLDGTTDSSTRPDATPVPHLPTVYMSTPLERVFELGSHIPFIRLVQSSKDPLLLEALSIVAFQNSDIDQWDSHAFRKLTQEVYTLLLGDKSIRVQIEEKHADFIKGTLSGNKSSRNT